MKTFFSVLLPIAAGATLVFLGLPIYGGNLDLLVQKMALDWEIPLVAVRIILSVASALIMTLVFQLVKKIALWLAIIVVLLMLFAPALLADIPIVGEEARTTIEQKLNL